MALLTLSLAACAQVPAPAPASPEPVGPVGDSSPALRCDAAKASSLVGETPSMPVQERARVAANAQVVRVLVQGQPITKEYRVGRLNLVVDGGGRIVSIHCG